MKCKIKYQQNQEKYIGRTKCMTPVIFESDNCKPGELVEVKIISYNQKNLFGSDKNEKEKAAQFSENK